MLTVKVKAYSKHLNYLRATACPDVKSLILINCITITGICVKCQNATVKRIETIQLTCLVSTVGRGLEPAMLSFDSQ